MGVFSFSIYWGNLNYEWFNVAVSEAQSWRCDFVHARPRHRVFNRVQGQRMEDKMDQIQEGPSSKETGWNPENFGLVVIEDCSTFEKEVVRVNERSLSPNDRCTIFRTREGLQINFKAICPVIILYMNIYCCKNMLIQPILNFLSFIC